MRFHTPADIQQQDVDGHFLALKIMDFLRLAVYPQHEIFGLKTLNGTICAVQHLRIHAGQRDVATERDGRFFSFDIGSWQCRRRGVGGQQGQRGQSKYGG